MKSLVHLRAINHFHLSRFAAFQPLPSLPSSAKPAFTNVTEMQRGDGESNSKGKTTCRPFVHVVLFRSYTSLFWISTFPTSTAKDFCRVTFALEATNEDELTLREDDIISIISKVKCCSVSQCARIRMTLGSYHFNQCHLCVLSRSKSQNGQTTIGEL